MFLRGNHREIKNTQIQNILYLDGGNLTMSNLMIVISAAMSYYQFYRSNYLSKTLKM